MWYCKVIKWSYAAIKERCLLKEKKIIQSNRGGSTWFISKIENKSSVERRKRIEYEILEIKTWFLPTCWRILNDISTAFQILEN